ncbi:MAG: hypothetical protein QNK23_02990 [Crocinitomicaceae bacterium]|nr:hypothetical protein [Crocinitomicaceae bacterium]
MMITASLNLRKIESKPNMAARNSTHKLNPTNIMRTSILLVALLLSFSSFSQEKKVNNAEMQERLTAVQLEIEQIDSKTASINQRIAGLPENEVDQSVYTILGDFDRRKQDLIKVAYSLNMQLSGNSPISPEIIVITKEEFDKYPESNQQQILAHPERYQVIGL